MREAAANAMGQDGQIAQAIADVNVLVAEPAGIFNNEEDKPALLQAIIHPLNERAGLAARLINQTFLRDPKRSLSDQYEKVVEEGRQTLQEEKGDLLLWGYLEPEIQSVRWHFLSAEEGEANLGVPGIAESLLVPFVPEKGSLDVLYAAIFAATRSSQPTHAVKIGEHLLGAVEPLNKLAGSLSNRKTPMPAKVSAMGMAAVVMANIAQRSKELGWFTPAIKAFKIWEEVVEKDKTPIDWALVTNHYGWLYEEMANHTDDEQLVDHISRAITLFEQVSEVLNIELHPFEWAAVQLRIAGTCAKIGRKMSEPEYLQKAARYYKKATKVYNQYQYPLNWAENMSKMAKTMMLHGQLVKGAQSLEQAGVAYQAVLKVYDEEKYPAQWANTQNNLGATLFALAKRDPHTHAWLDHALSCFENARDYYTENGRPQLVHVIDKNIAKAKELKEDIQARYYTDFID
ncbi:hypothetical protein [Terasakiella sp. SH-1]|uniref:hypothetical protein n=1 Tax=Terasakiella sp. SH-1 TaxID=2560057 RepID=UPI001072F6A4|nr:hypothetical protein [Terasakiella sp. SH-1]